jgi:hypothetical protein
MKRVLLATKIGCPVILTVAICLFLWRADRAYHQFLGGVTLAPIAKNINDSIGTIPKVTDAFSTAVNNASAAASNLSAVIADEHKSQTVQNKELTKIMGEARVAITRTDCNFNGGPGYEGGPPCVGLLPTVQETFNQLKLSLEEVDKLTEAGTSLANSGTAAVNSLNLRISDPKIDSILAHTDMFMLHAQNSADNVDIFTQHGDHIISYFDERLTSPRGFIKTLGAGLLGLVVPVANSYSAWGKPTAVVNTLTVKKHSKGKSVK